MDIGKVFDSATGFVALAALLGLALLLPLYLSQRRDLRRIRTWMERDPDHPVTDLAASESILDHAETELEELLGEPEPEPDTGVTPTTPMTAAARVTHERPALERITMERAALAPHPHWRRFVDRVTTTRALVAIGIVALLLGAAAIVVSQELLGGDDRPSRGRAGAIVPEEISVAVLNGTSVNGLGGKVQADVEAGGYDIGPGVGSTDPGFTKTVVLYADGQKRAAQKVARDLGVGKSTVERLDRATRRQAPDAEVVVIAGEDRA